MGRRYKGRENKTEQQNKEFKIESLPRHII
jgi:hypothetical protein